VFVVAVDDDACVESAAVHGERHAFIHVFHLLEYASYAKVRVDDDGVSVERECVVRALFK